MPRSYRHLRFAERDRIMHLRDARVPISKIAAELAALLHEWQRWVTSSRQAPQV